MLEITKPQAKLGERLKKNCPQNDCAIYLGVYERYTMLEQDIERIRGMGTISIAAISAVEDALIQSVNTINEMWVNNHAVNWYRKKFAAKVKRSCAD